MSDREQEQVQGSAQQQGDEVLQLVFRLIRASGAELPLCSQPGCWERNVGGKWWIAVNGHSRPQQCSRGKIVPPQCCYVEWRRIPAGLLDVAGAGQFACSPSVNVELLQRDLRAALKGADDEGP